MCVCCITCHCFGSPQCTKCDYSLVHKAQGIASLRSNRSQAHLLLKNYEAALADATASCELGKTYVKAWYRKARRAQERITSVLVRPDLTRIVCITLSASCESVLAGRG